MTPCVVLVGSVENGFRVFGPFPSHDHAVKFSDQAGDDTEILYIESPEAL